MAEFRILAAPYPQLPERDRERLEDIADAQFGHFPLVRGTQWSEPHFSYRAFEGDELVAFYNIIQRTVRIDGSSVDIAGVNNVITLPAHRGKGWASRLLRQTQPSWAQELGTPIGLLLCADALVSFYTRLGWELMRVPVRYSQPDGERAWPANCMLLDERRQLRATVEVDLCGLPW